MCIGSIGRGCSSASKTLLSSGECANAISRRSSSVSGLLRGNCANRGSRFRGGENCLTAADSGAARTSAWIVMAWGGRRFGSGRSFTGLGQQNTMAASAARLAVTSHANVGRRLAVRTRSNTRCSRPARPCAPIRCQRKVQQLVGFVPSVTLHFHCSVKPQASASRFAGHASIWSERFLPGSPSLARFRRIHFIQCRKRQGLSEFFRKRIDHPMNLPQPIF